MTKPHVLIVEDEPVVAKDLRQTLINFGYLIPPPVATGADAIRQAKETQPDLVLMDIVLKGPMNGIEAAQFITTHLDIPVVFLTAYANDSVLDQAKATTPVGYLQKPFQPTQLRTAIEIGLNEHRSKQRLRTAYQWLAATLQCMGDAVVVTDRTGRIRFMNRAAEALTGWAQADVPEVEADHLFRPSKLEAMREAGEWVGHVLRTGDMIHLREADLKGKDGTIRSIDGTAAPVRSEQGVIIGAVVTLGLSESAKKKDRDEHAVGPRGSPGEGPSQVDVLV
jgi:PAS domain S-box-containing protein